MVSSEQQPLNQQPMGAGAYPSPPGQDQQPQWAPQPQQQYQHQVQVRGAVRWQSELCGCMHDMGTCMDVCFCAPCVMGRVFDAGYQKQPDSMNPLVCCGAFVFGYFPCVWLLRDRMRKDYALEGDCFSDCLAACCCSACVLCQLSTELRHQGVDPGHCCCAPSVPARTQDGGAAAYPVAQPVQSGYGPATGAMPPQPAPYGTAQPTAPVLQ